METTKKGEFVALRFTGYANGSIFDSNEEENLKKISPESKAKESVIIIGKGMVVKGLDKELEGKEIGKEYEVKIGSKEGFGDRKKELVKTIPLKVFTAKNVNPVPGMVLALDDMIAKIITISGARVVTDFNNPLAGKDLIYKFKITRKVEDEKEKADSLFETSFKMIPEYEIKDKIVVKGPKIMEIYVKGFSQMFKELMGKELEFELKEEKTEKKDDKASS